MSSALIPSALVEGVEFECQRCGRIIEWWPLDDCDNCGGGHWSSPPYGIAHSRTGQEISLR